MPAYDTQIPTPPALYPGDSYLAFDAETNVGANTDSQQAAIGPNPAGGPCQLAVKVSYAVAPAATQIDIQGSVTDDDASYVTVATSNNVAGETFNINNFAYPFVRARDVTPAGQAVTVEIWRRN